MAPALRMGSMLQSLTNRFTNHDPLATKARSDGFLTAKGTDALFPRTQPEVDGEECLHDCETCTINYPKKFSIDEDDKLYGEIKGWNRHLIVATGKTDWVRDVADEEESVMAAVDKHMTRINNGRLMLSASNLPVPDEHKGEHEGPYGADRPTTVLLLPSFTFVDNVTPTHAPELIDSVINPSITNTTFLSPTNSPPTSVATTNGAPPPPVESTAPSSLPAGLTLRACPHKYLILLCSQATRDARCGQSAPLLRRELERHLRPLGLYRDLHDERPGGVGIYFISHVGGHKYSANMLVYRRGGEEVEVDKDRKSGAGRDGDARQGVVNGGGDNGEMGVRSGPNMTEGGEAAQCIWLARIRPEDCENVVRYTVLQGKVVKPERQLRGGFDRQRGVVSW